MSPFETNAFIATAKGISLSFEANVYIATAIVATIALYWAARRNGE